MEHIDNSGRMKAILTHMAKRLVDHPDHVSVSEANGPRTKVFEITVDKEDVGEVIGKRGYTVEAIRTIMTSIAGEHDKRVYIEVKE